VYGNGRNVREWIHVVDHCNAILCVLNKGIAGEVYNIGTGYTVANIDLVEHVLNKLGKSKDTIAFVEDRKGHDLKYEINSNKIKANLLWQPKIDFFDEGLDLTIDYYKNTL
jgi:dTDP-glucose 4,6-dehydratase